MGIRGIIVGFFLISSFIVSGQNFNKNDFFEADMALVSEDYERAQKIFERLLKSEPENANLNFLNGICLINIPGRKKESLEYFRKAAPYASADYEYGSYQEINAPLEIIKYYAMASKLNDDITMAIELLNRYKSMLDSKKKDEIALADALITSCYSALKLEEKPVFFKTCNLDNTLKSEESQLYPVVNNDETLLFYAVQGPYNKDDIYFSQKVNGTWTEPVKITAQLGVKGECYPSSVSYDNERLYLTVKTGTSTDIYYSVFSKSRWQKAIKMDKPINGKGWDSQACETPEGNYLYFASDRKGGFGNMDLYRSEKDENGKWMKPVNLGEQINTEQNELMPVISADNSKLFFKSEAYENVGGYDIFVSEQTGDHAWSRPANIGYPLNTPDDDIYFMPVGNGNFAYASFEDPDNSSKNEIVRLEVFSASHPRQFDISGQVMLQDEDSGLEKTEIEVYNTESYQKVLTTQPDRQTGRYSFEVGTGGYMINYVNPDYKTYTQLIDLPPDNPEDALVIDAMLEKAVPVAEVTPTYTPEVIEENSTHEPESFSGNENITTEIRTPEKHETEYIPAETKTNRQDNDYNAINMYYGMYTIQFMASIKKIDMAYIGGNNKVEIQKGDDEYYRYTTGIFNSIAEAESILRDIVLIQYKDAFIRPYNVSDYLDQAAKSSSAIYTIQFMALKKEINTSYFKSISNIKVSLGNDGFYRYTTGEFKTLSAARQEFNYLINQGYSDAFIRKITDVPNYH